MRQIPNDYFFSWVEKELTEGRSVRIRLKGNSMFPLLRNGRDEVILCPCEESGLQPMDVVLFRYGGKHLLHRIVRKDGNRLLIQGDGSLVAQEECTVSDVVGKLQQVIRPSGKIVPVKSWKWQLPSRLWRGLGIFRVPFLRILRFFMNDCR